MPVATVDLAGVGAIIVGVGGFAGAIIAALKYRREDTTQIVTQQSTLLGDMKSLNDELVEATARLRAERDELEREGEALRKERDRLAVEIHRSRGNVADVERDADALRARIRALEVEIEALQREIAGLRAEIRRLRETKNDAG